MTDTPVGTAMEIRQHTGWFTALGILFIIGGAFAIISPWIAGVTVALVVGWTLIFVGAVDLYQSWSTRSWGGFIWQVIIGLIILAGGISFLVNPIQGAITLTLLIGILFAAKGVMQLIMGFQYRPREGWGWIVAAGIIAIVLGVMILAGWPQSSIWVVGTLVGISLIFSGWSYIMISMAARRV
jgi:uncharacterized membrane protein HdeD (DUF308 family)